ncbi:MAG: S-layer family protein [Terracidiphilus sp.]|jgi:hypothetical protein
MIPYRSQAGSLHLGLFKSALVLLALACFASVPAWSQTWLGTNSDLWNDETNWLGGVPDSSTANAVIDLPLKNPVLFNDFPASVGTLTLGTGTSLNFVAGTTMYAYGATSGACTGICNAGAITLNAGSGNNTALVLESSLSLSGGGTLTLNSGNNNGAAYIEQGTGGLTLSNVDNTIEGYGTIGNGGISLDNESAGIINANSSGNSLILNGGNITNAGLMEGTGGGTLSVGNLTLSNSGANITANGGNVSFSSTTIQGGTLNSLNSGTIGVLASGAIATLDGTTAGAVTISTGSTWTGALNTTTDVSGSIINNGTISLTAGSGNNTELNLLASTTLSGGGTVTMNSGDNNGKVYIEQSYGGLTLTNADNTIQGCGVIGNGGISLDNESAGIINANSSGNTLALNGGNITNTGLIEATGGGILSVGNLTLDNSGGNITASGGTVNFSSTTIQGGTLNSLNGGTLGVTSSGTAATLDGTTAGAITISTGTTWTGALNTTTYVNGSIINNGAISLTAGSGNNTDLNLLANTTLSGGGTLTMNSGDNNGQVYIQQSYGGLTLTNVDNTIQGYGEIGNGGLALINENGGTIDANVSGKTLTLNNSGGITNTGTLEATNGGTLNISGITVNDVGSGITANGGAVVINNGTEIDGGFLTNTNSGTIGNGGGVAYLNGSTSAGAITITTGSTWTGAANSTTYVNGSIVNNGNIQLFAGSGDNSALNLYGGTSLSGGGTVTLNSGDNNGAAYIEQASGGYTLTNVDNTIQGYGTIGNGGLTLVNESAGTVNANVASETLTLNNSGGITNTGLLEGTNSGTLNINGISVNNDGGNITANGGTVLISNNAEIDGGTLNTLNGGTLGNGGSSAYLNGGTAAGAVTLSAGSTWTGGLGSVTYTNSSIINNGNIQLYAGSGNSAYLILKGDTTLSGGGTVTLNSGDNDGYAYIEQNSGGMTLTNSNNTIQGYGVIGNGGLTVTNESAGTINANVSGETLTLNNSGGIVNTGLLEGTNGGTLNISGITVTNTGGNITANGGTVLVTGAEIDGGTLNSLNGGTLGNGSSSAYLNGGTTAGAVTLSAGSTWTGGLGSITFTNGSIVNNGNIQLNGGYGNATYLALEGDTTFSGGGTITLNSGDNNGKAYIEQNSGGITLTNSDNTIQGYGVIGNSGLTVINGASGTILANSAGNTLLINTSGNVTNNGTFQANAGSTLQVTSNLTNFSAGTLTGGSYIANGASATPATIQLSLGSNTGGEILTNAATIVLSGPGSGIFDSNSYNALSALATNSGSLTLTNGQQLTSSAATLVNTGAVTVGTNSGLTADGYSQTGGTTLVDGTLIATGGSGSVSGGTLSGTGTLGSDIHPMTLSITGTGVLNPGDSGIGTLTVNGNYSQSGGTLLEDIGGNAASNQYGVTDVTGSVTLGTDATLDVDLIDGFTPAANTEYSYIIIDPFSDSGIFVNIDCNVPNGDTCNVVYNADDIVLDINGPVEQQGPPPVPEPGTFPLLLTGLAGIATGIKARMGRKVA